MSLDYRLTLAGRTPIEQVAERALPEPAERPTGTAPLLSAKLLERHGFDVTVRSGRNGYVDVMADQGPWEWEPGDYVSVAFHVDKLADPATVALGMLTAVRRVLAGGPEDAALVLNGDILLLTRLDGALTKHHRDTWWSSYPGADDLIRG